ncbi:MAG TPA: phosphoribosyltransferase family protein [Nitriliruptorales bacterium]
MALSPLLAPVLDLLVPHRCVTCGARAEPPWCTGCARAAAARSIDPATSCPACAGPGGRHACWDGDPPVTSLVARYRYGGPVADAVVAGKTRGVRAVWEPLGGELARRLGQAAGTDVGAVTWVPAPAGRRRQRGFDQSQLLARAVGLWLGCPAVRLLEAHPGLPDRGRADAPDRAVLTVGAYRPRAGIAPPARVLLVDDVLTTGSTLRAATDALRAAGVEHVHGAVVARAGTHQLVGRAGQPARHR